MPQIDQPPKSAAIRALIPELRVAARELTDESAASPDDLVQDALGVALRSWDRLPPCADLKPWLLGILSERARTVGKPGLVEGMQQLGAPPTKGG